MFDNCYTRISPRSNEMLRQEALLLYASSPMLDRLDFGSVLQDLKSPLRDEEHLMQLSKRIHPAVIQNEQIRKIREVSNCFRNPKLEGSLINPVCIARFATLHFHRSGRFLDVLAQFPEELTKSSDTLYYTTEMSSITYTPIENQLGNESYTVAVTRVWKSQLPAEIFIKPQAPPKKT